MDSVTLVEVRKGEAWHVAILQNETSSNASVFLSSRTQSLTIARKDYADYRTNTFKDQGFNQVIQWFNFMDFDWVYKKIQEIKKSSHISSYLVNQDVRGKIFLSLLQMFEYYSSYSVEQATGYFQVIKDITEFYLNLLDLKIVLQDGPFAGKNIGFACLGEIETVIRLAMGLDDPGKAFFSFFQEKVYFPIALELSQVSLTQYVKMMMIHSIPKVIKIYKNLDSLPFIDLFGMYIDEKIDDLKIDLDSIKSSVKDFLEVIFYKVDQIDLKGRDISKIHSNLIKFQVPEAKICECFLNFLQKPLTATQKLQVFESLDKISDHQFKLEIIRSKEKYYYKRLLEQESFVKFIIKYIKVFIDENQNEFISSIINSIDSREVFNALVKTLTSKVILFNQKEILAIFTEVIKKYMIDSRFVIIDFINSIFFNFGSEVWSKVFQILYNEIPKKDEPVFLIKSVLDKEENLVLRNNVLIQILQSENQIYSQIASAIINSHEFFKLKQFYSEITDAVVACLKKNSEISVHFQCLVKILENIENEKIIKKTANDKSKREIFFEKIMKSVLEAFQRCEKDRDTCASFLVLARETNDRMCLDSIMRILEESIKKRNLWEEEQNLMLVIFLKINNFHHRVILSNDFWKSKDGFNQISRKSDKKLDYEDMILDIYFYGRLEQQQKTLYQIVILSLFTKFDTSNEWTKKVKTEFSSKLLNYPNTQELIQTFSLFFEGEVLPHESLTIENLKSTILRSETYEASLLFRKILSKTPDNRLSQESIASFFNSNPHSTLKLIIIERVVKLSDYLAIFYKHLENLLSYQYENFGFGQIIFYIIKHSKDFNVTHRHFHYFLESIDGLYKQDSNEQNESFSAFFERLKMMEDDFQIKMLKSCLMSALNKKVFNVDWIEERIEKGEFFSEMTKVKVISGFFKDILDDEQEFNQDIDHLIQSLIDDHLDMSSPDFDSNSIFTIKSYEKNYIIRYIKIVYNLANSKRFSTCGNQQVLGYYLSYLMDVFFDFTSYSPLILNQSIQSQAMILFSLFQETRVKLYGYFMNFFNSFQVKLKSKTLSYKISSAGIPKSLKNFGTTCYINSILQLIYKIADVKYLMLNYQNNHPSLQVLKFIIQKLKFTIRKSVSSKKFIERYELYEGVYIEKFNQGDASEFFNTIICKLQDEGIEINKIFGFQVTTSYNCECKITKISNQDQTTLDLDLTGEEKLSDLIKSFSSTKKLDENNWALCESCNTKSIKTWKSDINHWPNYLICVLKRFKFDLAAQSTVKITDEILIENTIDLNNNQYEAIFFINHFGNAQEGHYVSYSKRKGSWFEIDDNIVKPLTGFEPENKESIPKDCNLGREYTPYIILYRKKDLIKVKVEISPDQEVLNKNFMYVQASVYCGDPIIEFLSNYISINLSESSYFLMHSLPYQQIYAVTLLNKVYQKFAETLDQPQKRAEFRQVVKNYMVNVLEIFTGFTSNDFKLVLSALILKAFRESPGELYSTFYYIFALDHMQWDFTFIIEFFVEELKTMDNKLQQDQMIFNYFVNRKIEGIDFQFKVQKISGTNFSCFFKLVYNDSLLFQSLSSYLTIEMIRYLSAFPSFQVSPKWLSKVISKKVKVFNEQDSYLDLINQLSINFELKQRLVYDMITEESPFSELFKSQKFLETLQIIRGSWNNISLLEKIAKEFSRKISENPVNIKNCLKTLISGKNEIGANLIENLRKTVMESFNKFEKIVNEILGTSKKYLKKNENKNTLSFWNSGFKLDSFEDLEIIDDAKNGLIIVRHTKI